MSSQKRRAEGPIEVVDLISDDDTYGPSSSRSSAPSSATRPNKSARTSYDGRGEPGASQDNAIPIHGHSGHDDEEEDGSQEVADATQSYNEAELRWTLYGVHATEIVGCQYYNGVATEGEMVIIRREPQNQYDVNAIQVLNMQERQIGHIPRRQAAKLAPYMDQRLLLLEGYITGYKSYTCPISIRLYGTNDPAAREALVAKMRADKLPVSNVSQRVRAEQKAQKERQKMLEKAAKQAKKSGAVMGSQGMQFENSMGEFAASQMQGMGLGELSLEEIMAASERFTPRNIEQVVEKFGVKEEDLAAMPKAAQPQALSTEMHPFQLQGLQWMLDKESPKLPAADTKDVVQLWQPRSDRKGYINLATSFSLANPPLFSGGILADDMGLGKTIQVISLVMADRALGTRPEGACDATLILAPVSVMSNWSTQIAKHIKKQHALRVMFWHGSRKQPITPKEIDNYDVVITTYDSVSSDWHSQKTTKLPRRSGPYSVKWRRVILDEGHNIRNPKAKKAIAAYNLMAASRWALTGTPIINTLKDLYSIVRFLGISAGLEKLDIFHSAIIRPVSQGEEQGNKALQLLMGGICLRRKKEMPFIDLRLPELSEYVHKFSLLPHEQEKYDALEAQAKGTLDIYRQNVQMHNNNASETYRHLLEVLLRMRQVCNHWQLVGEERLDSILKQLEAEGVVDLTEENKSALQQMLQLSIDSQEDCPVCLESLSTRDPVITKCAHVFCTPCLERVIDTQHKCPMCRADLESLATTTVKPAKETSAALPLTQDQIKDKESLEKNTSSKVSALLSILNATHKKDPTSKTIVFSQWTSFLDILRPHLSAAGLTYTRIDGSMSALQRDAALSALDSDPHTTIMLASLSVCSVGLNLVAANQVIMSDSWWAPAIEDQAVDRVHRLGQKRETRVLRLVVEGSIEERVLGIQEDKRKLMNLAFAERGEKRKRAGAGLGDLERLVGGRA